MASAAKAETSANRNLAANGPDVEAIVEETIKEAIAMKPKTKRVENFVNSGASLAQSGHSNFIFIMLGLDEDSGTS